MEKIKSLDRSLSEYLSNYQGSLENPKKKNLKALKNNLKRLELMEVHDCVRFNEFLSDLHHKKIKDKPFVFIQYYVSILCYEAGICDKNYQQIENSVVVHLNSLKSLDFRENLFKTIFFTFQEMVNIRDIQDIDIPSKDNYQQLSESLEKLIKRAGINYRNLKKFIFDKISNKNLYKTIKFFFSKETVFYSQILRSQHEEKYRPNPENNTKPVFFSLFIRNSSNSQELLYNCAILPKGYPHTKIFCEDGLVYIGGIYKDYLENDILIDISKNNLYRIVLFCKTDGFYVDCVESIYHFVNKSQQRGRLNPEFFAFHLLKSREIAAVKQKMTIKIGESIEFYVKNINFSEKTIKVLFTAGYLRDKMYLFSFESPITIGDHSANIKIIGDDSVSKTHCKIFLHKSKLKLENLSNHEHITGVFYGWRDKLIKINEKLLISLKDNHENFEILLESK